MKKVTYLNKLLLILLISIYGQINAQVLWSEKAVTFPVGYTNVTGISAIDNNNIWVYSDNTTTNKIGFSKTMDSNTWNSSGEINYGTGFIINSFQALTGSNAYALFYNTSDDTGLLNKTIDGGTTWTAATTTVTFPDFVHFFDANSGIIVCDPDLSSYFIYKTTNGGVNWDLINMTNLPTFISGEFFVNSSYRYYQNSLWFTTNKGRIFKTTNQGTSWTAVQTPYNSGYLGTAISLGVGFSLEDDNTAYILNGTGLISKTIDGGINWTNIGNTNTLGSQDIFLIPNTNLLMSTNTANSKYSTDNGQNWTVIDNSYKKNPKSLNLNATWAIGSNKLFKLNPNLLSTNTTSTSNKLNWQGDSSLYQIEYGIGNFTQGTGTLIDDISGSFYDLTGLLPNTLYTYYLRSKSAGSFAPWQSNTFTTTIASVLSLNSNVLNDSFEISPNPTQNLLNITSQETIKSINIIDLLGRKTNITNFENNKIDVSKLAGGVYFIEITTENSSGIEKFIKN
jgi:hypothetical protein